MYENLTNLITDSRFYFFLSVFLILTIAFLVVRLNRANHKREQLETFLKTSFEEEKRERMDIVYDIHRGISGDLASIRIFLSLALRTDNKEKQEEMSLKVYQGIDLAFKSLAVISNSVIPKNLVTGDLYGAILEYFIELRKTTEIEFYMLNKGGTDYFKDKNCSYEIFKIIREITTFRIKFGEISSYSVSFEKDDKIYIWDDGISYSINTLSKNLKHLGMVNVFYRARAINLKIYNKVLNNKEYVILHLKEKEC